MATFVGSRVFSIAPWLNTGEIAPVTTPRPTCIGLALEPPTVWLTRSMNVTPLDLKPIVLMFARLLPITLRYCAFAFRPDRPAENEPTAIRCTSFTWDRRGRSPRSGAGLRLRLDLCRIYAKGSADGLEGLLNLRELLERAERRQLRDELAVVLGRRWILVLQLRYQQLEERVLAHLGASIDERRRRVLLRTGRGNRVGHAVAPSLS